LSIDLFGSDGNLDSSDDYDVYGDDGNDDDSDDDDVHDETHYQEILYYHD